jgi:NTP pyrophosphatase (non-canonical NTP hydrolase)
MNEQWSADPCGCDLGALHVCERHEAEGRAIIYDAASGTKREFINLQSRNQLVPVERMKQFLGPGNVLNRLARQVHESNQHWWTDLHTGEPIQRNVGELLALVHSEISEALEGHRKSLPDDKLPHRPMFEVELADAVIRILDIAGGYGLDLGGAFEEKMKYNATRHDHTREGRLAANGKKY